MDNKEGSTESNMPGIHKGTQRQKEGGRRRKEVEAVPSLEGVNERGWEGEREGEETFWVADNRNAPRM